MPYFLYVAAMTIALLIVLVPKSAREGYRIWCPMNIFTEYVLNNIVFSMRGRRMLPHPFGPCRVSYEYQGRT